MDIREDVERLKKRKTLCRPREGRLKRIWLMLHIAGV